MKGWKRIKRHFSKKKSVLESRSTKRSHVLGSTISTSSISSRLGTHRSTRHRSVRHAASIVADHKSTHRKQSHSNSPVAAGSKAVSRSQSRESHHSKKSHGTERSKSLKSTRQTQVRLEASASDGEPTTVTFQRKPIIVRRSFDTGDSLGACDAHHEGRTLLQEKFYVKIDVLFNMLFSHKSLFLKKFHEMRQSKDLHMGEWIRDQNGEQHRTVKVTVALQGNVGPKTSNVTEHQKLRKCSQPGHLYSIDVNSSNAGIPYADAFSVLMHFCLTSTDDNFTNVLIIGQVKFLKPVWAVIKVFIEKNAYAGLEEFFQAIQIELLKDFRNH